MAGERREQLLPAAHHESSVLRGRDARIRAQSKPVIELDQRRRPPGVVEHAVIERVARGASRRSTPCSDAFLHYGRFHPESRVAGVVTAREDLALGDVHAPLREPADDGGAQQPLRASREAVRGQVVRLRHHEPCEAFPAVERLYKDSPEPAAAARPAAPIKVAQQLADRRRPDAAVQLAAQAVRVVVRRRERHAHPREGARDGGHAAVHERRGGQLQMRHLLERERLRTRAARRAQPLP
mmetsp:Transcript_37156/g.116813  ORF Transcript_37156/g.116813 Transcript_37156/m.116813 type:complete len:240 (+) Transcript_37156:202-921(+)